MSLILIVVHQQKFFLYNNLFDNLYNREMITRSKLKRNNRTKVEKSKFQIFVAKENKTANSRFKDMWRRVN